MKKPSVLFVVPSLARAGAEKQVVDLANGLAGNGFDCHLTSFEANRDQLDRLDSTAVRYHEITRRWKYDLGVAARIADILDSRRIDVLHCTLSLGVFYGFLAAKRATRRPAVIAGVHTTLSRSWKDEFLERFVFRWPLRSADRVVFVCRRQMEYWLGRDPNLTELAAVIYNGVDHVEFDRGPWGEAGRQLKQDLGMPAADRAICCIAAFRQEKAQGNLVRALANLTGSHTNVHLLLAGQGEERPVVERLAADLGLSDRIHFLGKLADVRPVLAAAEFSVISSIAVETFSFAMLESMAMGVPVLSTRIGGAEEAILPGVTGALVASGNIEEMTAAMKDLLDDPERTSDFGRNARRLVEEKFSCATMVSETAALVSRVHDEH